MQLLIKKIHPEAKIPVISTDYSAGYDLFALDSGEVGPRSHTLVQTGISIRLPRVDPIFKVYGSIRSRSSLSYKYGIEVGAGVIDFDYTNDVGVILFNHSDVAFKWDKHDRIGQLILEVHVTPSIAQVEEFKDLSTNRTGGFGSTGR